VLHALVGYVARPTGIQILFYAATLLVIGALMRRGGGDRQRPRRVKVVPRPAE
jgi:high-affinity iron transporter